MLKNRCEWRGIDVELTSVNSVLDLQPHDVYFIGNGPDSSVKNVVEDLIKSKSFLLSERDNSAIFLGVCAGFKLLGNFFELNNGEYVSGLTLFDVDSKLGKTRFTGNVTAKSEHLSNEIIVGFENHLDIVNLKSDVKSLANVLIGNGNNGQDKTEGAVYKNVFGTNLHGPVLALNPHFADYLISLALEKRYGKKIELTMLNDDFETKAHSNLVDKVY